MSYHIILDGRNIKKFHPDFFLSVPDLRGAIAESVYNSRTYRVMAKGKTAFLHVSYIVVNVKGPAMNVPYILEAITRQKYIVPGASAGETI